MIIRPHSLSLALEGGERLRFFNELPLWFRTTLIAKYRFLIDQRYSFYCAFCLSFLFCFTHNSRSLDIHALPLPCHTVKVHRGLFFTPYKHDFYICFSIGDGVRMFKDNIF